MKPFNGLAETVKVLREYRAITQRTGEAPSLVEAETLRGLAAEDRAWSPLSGQSRDLQPWNQTRMLEKVNTIYRQNHMAHRVLNLAVDFVVGDGINATAKGDESDENKNAVQDAIDSFWHDPINAMDRLMPQRLLEWLLWGEMLMPVRTAANGSGKIRLGWIDPLAIRAVNTDPATSAPAEVILQDSVVPRVGVAKLQVIRWIEKTETLEGDAFFYPRNHVMGAGRGISELYTGHDWMTALDRTLRAAALRAEILNYFIWDVTLKGKDEPAVRKWLQEHGSTPPKPAAIRAHNDAVVWEAKAPDLGSRDNADFLQAIKTYIMGGFGYPNHWFGSGDDANLATAAVMSEPTRRALRKIGKDLGHVLTDVLMFALGSVDRGTAREASDPKLAADDWTPPFDIQIPDVAGPDVAKVGAAVVAVTNAIVVAEEKGFVSHETAMSLFAAIAAQTGLEIDPAEEKAKIEVEEKERGDDENREDADREAKAAAALRTALVGSGGGAGGGQAAETGGSTPAPAPAPAPTKTTPVAPHAGAGS